MSGGDRCPLHPAMPEDEPLDLVHNASTLMGEDQEHDQESTRAGRSQSLARSSTSDATSKVGIAVPVLSQCSAEAADYAARCS